MSIVYAAGLKTTRMQAVRDAIDAGAGAGKLNIYSAGYAALLVSIVLADPASTVVGSVLTLAGMPKEGTGLAAAGAGTNAAIARFVTSADVMVAENLVVGVGSGDIQIDNLSIADGQTVEVTAGTITHA